MKHKKYAENLEYIFFFYFDDSVMTNFDSGLKVSFGEHF